MTFSILERGESFIQKRKKRRRLTAAFGCLAVVAAVGTGYALKRDGTAVNYEYRELVCTYEVHEHTDECYDAEGKLICGKADYVIHVHNDDCYDENGELVCTLPEIEAHQHEESCFEEMPVLICGEEGIEQDEISEEAEAAGADNKTAVEEAQPPKTDNAAAFDGDVSGNDAAQAASNSEETADTEATGSAETAQEATPADSAEAVEASTENTADSAEAVEASAENTADSGETEEASAENTADGAEEAAPADSSQETENTETSDSDTAAETAADSGETAEAAAADDSQLTNASDEDMASDAPTVDKAEEAEPEISADAEESAEPENPNVHVHTEECYEPQMVPTCGQLELHKHTEECYDETGALICGLLELEEHVHDENCFEILEPAAGRRTFYGEDYTITVSYGVEAGLPEEVEFSAEEIKPGTAAYEEYRRQALDVLGKEDGDITSGRIFDIRFVLNDEEIEPKATVDVEISYQNEEPKILLDDPKVVHFAGEEEIPEVIDAEGQEGTYTFTADGFSPMFMALNEVDPNTIKVRIVDNIAGDREDLNVGCLYAELYTGENTENAQTVDIASLNGYTVELTWYKKDPKLSAGGEEFVEVHPRWFPELSAYDVAGNGEWLNAALNEGAECEYRVKLTIRGEGEGTTNREVESASCEITYYDELKNGDFEAPEAYDDSEEERAEKQKIERDLKIYSSEHPELIWKSTADYIEFVDIRPDPWYEPNGTEKHAIIMSHYNWYGEIKDASGGKQFAEINGGSEGALYQTVLTTPGTTLNWEFFHRARGVNNNSTAEYDEMYLVIMPENVAKSYDNNHDGLKGFLGIPDTSKETNAEVMETANSESAVYKGVNGVQIVRVVSDDQNWHQCNGIYTVPEGQYLTRFFFVAGRTSSESNSAGNFIDKIWFSTDLPEPVPVPEGYARLTIKKYVYGLSEADLEELKKGMYFKVEAMSGHSPIVSSKNMTWQKGDGCWVGVGTVDIKLWGEEGNDRFNYENDMNRNQFAFSSIKEEVAEMYKKGYKCDTWARAGEIKRSIAPTTTNVSEDISTKLPAETGQDIDWVWSERNAENQPTGNFVHISNIANNSGNEIVKLKFRKDESGNIIEVTDLVAEFVNDYTISNSDLKIVKTAQDGTTKLAGAEFTVEVDEKSYRASTGVEEGATTETDEDVTIGQNGEVTIRTEGLLFDKFYSLTETKAPKGYVGLQDTIYFKLSRVERVKKDTNGNTVMDENGNPETQIIIITTFYDSNKKEIGEGFVSANSPEAPTSQGERTEPVTITVRNDVQVSLPETGGPGTKYYRYIGIALFAAGLIYGYSVWKKRERRAS